MGCVHHQAQGAYVFPDIPDRYQLQFISDLYTDLLRTICSIVTFGYLSRPFSEHC